MVGFAKIGSKPLNFGSCALNFGSKPLNFAVSVAVSHPCPLQFIENTKALQFIENMPLFTPLLLQFIEKMQ